MQPFHLKKRRDRLRALISGPTGSLNATEVNALLNAPVQNLDVANVKEAFLEWKEENDARVSKFCKIILDRSRSWWNNLMKSEEGLEHFTRVHNFLQMPVQMKRDIWHMNLFKDMKKCSKTGRRKYVPPKADDEEDENENSANDNLMPPVPDIEIDDMEVGTADPDIDFDDSIIDSGVNIHNQAVAMENQNAVTTSLVVETAAPSRSESNFEIDEPTALVTAAVEWEDVEPVRRGVPVQPPLILTPGASEGVWRNQIRNHYRQLKGQGAVLPPDVMEEVMQNAFQIQRARDHYRRHPGLFEDYRAPPRVRRPSLEPIKEENEPHNLPDHGEPNQVLKEEVKSQGAVSSDEDDDLEMSPGTPALSVPISDEPLDHLSGQEPPTVPTVVAVDNRHASHFPSENSELPTLDVDSVLMEALGTASRGSPADNQNAPETCGQADYNGKRLGEQTDQQSTAKRPKISTAMSVVNEPNRDLLTSNPVGESATSRMNGMSHELYRKTQEDDFMDVEDNFRPRRANARGELLEYGFEDNEPIRHSSPIGDGSIVASAAGGGEAPNHVLAVRGEVPGPRSSPMEIDPALVKNGVPNDDGDQNLGSIASRLRKREPRSCPPLNANPVQVSSGRSHKQTTMPTTHSPSLDQEPHFYVLDEKKEAIEILKQGTFDIKCREVLGPIKADVLTNLGKLKHWNAYYDTNKHILCPMCDVKHYLVGCKLHPMYWVKNITVNNDGDQSIPQAIWSFPPRWFELSDDTIADQGIKAVRKIPVGLVFGPFVGEVTAADECKHDDYSWSVTRDGKDVTLDSFDKEKSNWMRWANSPNEEADANIEAIEWKGNIYYMTKKVIQEKEEVLVWYGPDYGAKLRAAREKKEQEKKDEEEERKKEEQLREKKEE